MARHLRVEFPGAIYHVTCRMIGDWRTQKTYLFKDDADHERFLERLGERVEQYNIRLYLYTLMTNHFHLVFETPGANCSKFMHSLSTAYTVYYNLRHRRHGHLLDGRFKAKLVDGDDYLLALTRYVHLNPVCVGSIKHKPIQEKIEYLRGYRWSSYQSYIGKQKALDFVEYGPMLAEVAQRLNSSKRVRQGAYRKCVESGLAQDDEDFKVAMKKSPRSIGGSDFRAWIDELYEKMVEEHAEPEDVSFRHITEPLSSDTVMEVLCDILKVEAGEFRQRRRNSPLRGIAAKYLLRYAGQTQREAAKLLGAGSGSTISKHLTRLRDRLPEDKKLARLLRKAQKRLNDEWCNRNKRE